MTTIAAAAPRHSNGEEAKAKARQGRLQRRRSGASMGGRDRGYTKLWHDLQRTTAWRAIARSGAALLLLEIWLRHNGRNNGAIPYSVRDAVQFFRCSPKKAVRWLRELQETGFIVAVQRGSFQQKTGAFAARATTWRLTMEPCDGNPPTHDYCNLSEIGDRQ